MLATDPNLPPVQSFWQEDPFSIIKPEEYGNLGIDSDDIPPGTLAAQRHPPLLSSRFGGNAYGFGFYEIYDHLEQKDIEVLQSIEFHNPDQIKEHYREINRIYGRIGLLIRFTNQGRPYYLIPAHLVSISITNIKNKADEIGKIIHYHRSKYLKESHKIGVLTHEDDPIINDLSIRFKEHKFIIIDSPEKLNTVDEVLDLVIFTRDIYRTILLEKIGRRPGEMISRAQLEKHAIYMLGKIYKLLKPDGEIFIIAHHQPLKTNRWATITFKSLQEKINFFLFTHIFKTSKKYHMKGDLLQINIFDLEKYLGTRYVESDVIERLLGKKALDSITPEEIERLPYLNLPLDNDFSYDQQKVWPKLLSIYFDDIFHKPRIPGSVKAQWKRRFIIEDYSPNYMLIHLAQKKPLDITIDRIKERHRRISSGRMPLASSCRISGFI